MGENTKIQWCDHTFNPWIGCAKVSLGCDNCYAERYGKRVGVKWGANAERKRTSAATWKQPLAWDRKSYLFRECCLCGYRGTNLTFKPDRDYLICPSCDGNASNWKPVRQRVFCGSLCDVFDNAVPDEWRADLFRLIVDTPNLDWLLLTKRIGNVQNMLKGIADYGLPNVWLGATICNQEEAIRDIPKLLAVPAAKRFISVEPMLGPIALQSVKFDAYTSMDVLLGSGVNRRALAQSIQNVFCEKLDWVICGGETGAKARPMHPGFVRNTRDQCVAAGVPFFFKQWGEFHPSIWSEGGDVFIGQTDGYRTVTVDGLEMVRCGKKSAGRFLDGREWNEVPE